MLPETEYLVLKRGRFCEYCGRYSYVLHRHHWLFHRMKGFPELDVEENIGLVCDECHMSGIVNSYDSRVFFWNKQLARYDMYSWWVNLPLKTKERFWCGDLPIKGLQPLELQSLQPLKLQP